MTVRTEIHGGIPAEQLTPEVTEALKRLAEENGLLRAALAEARARVGDLEESSEVDPVTGLPNERELARALDRVVSQSERHGTPAAMISIDLKGLAAINERHGRIAGDAALSHVARLLRSLIRTSDVAARSGAGFALLLDHLDPDSAVETGERIAHYVASQPLDLGSSQVALDATWRRQHPPRRQRRGRPRPRRAQSGAGERVLSRPLPAREGSSYRSFR
jgi:diguanylate cyclase (GGDEF)-like protein